MDRSLQGLPPIRRSKGPHSASWEQHVRLMSFKLGCTFRGRVVISVSTHMFLGDGPNVVDVFDLPLVLHHPHGDGILTDLWGNVAFDLKSQISEHQIPWRNKNKNRLLKSGLGMKALGDASAGLKTWAHLSQCRQRARAPWWVCADQQRWRGRLCGVPGFSRRSKSSFNKSVLVI